MQGAVLICILVSLCYQSKTSSYWIKGKYTGLSASGEKPLQKGKGKSKILSFPGGGTEIYVIPRLGSIKRENVDIE